MNIGPVSTSATERELLETLRNILAETNLQADVHNGGPWRGRGDLEPTARVILRTVKGEGAQLWVKVIKEAHPGYFEAWAKGRRPIPSDHPAVPVLATRVVSDRLAEVCGRAGWGWYDLAGNCRISIPGLLHVERRGIPPIRGTIRPSASLGTPAAARVIRALLTPSHAGRAWTHRELMAQTCWRELKSDRPVSLGLINKVVRHLRKEGFVEEAESGGIRLQDPRGLLGAWNTAYRFDRHERRDYFTLLKGTQLERSLCQTGTGGTAAYAAFSAAERQAPHVRQARTWVYVAALDLAPLVRHAEAKPVESGENLILLIPDDVGVFQQFGRDNSRSEGRLPSTDPVQTYVDLLHCGGRGEEAAQAILEQILLPAWKKAGSE